MAPAARAKLSLLVSSRSRTHASIAGPGKTASSMHNRFAAWIAGAGKSATFTTFLGCVKSV